MRHIFIYLIIWLLSLPALAQNEIASKYAATITQEDLKELLTIIASDALEGRETGTRGQKMAAAFIEEEFNRIGLQPIVSTPDGKSYLQKFKLENYDVDGIYLETNGIRYSLKDNILFSGRHGMANAETPELLFVSNSGLDNLSELSIKDKVTIISAIGIKSEEYNTIVESTYHQGAVMVILIPFDSEEKFKQYRRSEGRNYARTYYAFEQRQKNNMPNGYFLLSPQIFGAIIGEDQNTVVDLLAKDASVKLIREINNKGLKVSYFTSSPTKQIETENVLGYLQGSDKKDELVVITAHYDHIGRRGEQINNGADDDGSGTSAVLEIAEAYALAKDDGHGPRRSMLFMTVTGEEKGLIGSQYYTNNPVIPLANTVVDLNLDMVGRHDEAHDDNREFVYLVGSDRLSTELHELSEKTNNTFTQLSLDYTYNDENHPDRIYYRSDHWNFAKHNVPIIFYFNGVHEDYHRPTDTVDKIEFDLLQKRAQLVFYTSWVIANRDQKLVVDKIQNTAIKPNN